MSRAGAIPYFGDAYMADTRHLTLEEHGAYHLLLLIAWRSPNCALPEDDKRLAQMLGITAKKWANLKPSVMAFWTATENGWEQKRLTKERRWVEEKKAKNKSAAEARWEPKPKKTKEPRDANAYANGQPNGHANGYAPPPPPLGSNEPIISSIEDKSAEPTAQPLTEIEILEAWQDRMVPLGFPAVRRMTPARRRSLKARMREYPDIDDWQKAFSALERSNFCKGDNDRGWRADFDFLCQSKSLTKLIEGAYDH
jgi:uncharacterized protein YdaU (DUF1376 family)